MFTMFTLCVKISTLFLLLTLVKCELEILIMHNNDMHARFAQTDVNGKIVDNLKPEESYGGFARLKQAVIDAKNEAASQNISAIFLNAGDTFQGTAFYTILKESVVSALIKLLPIDVMSLGNHEFDDGVDLLARYLNEIDIPVVACNLNFTDEPSLQLPILTSSKILNISNTKIGVIGYLLPETQNTSSAGKVIFYDEIESIRKEAKRLKAQNVNIIIALGHSGFEMDQKIAQSIPELSLVIGGHTNTFLYSPTDKPPSIEIPAGPYPFIVKQSSGKEVPVLQAFAYTKYLGKLYATFNENGSYISSRPNSNPMLLDSKIRIDQSIEDKVNEYRKQIQNKTRDQLGETVVLLDGWKSGCKAKECNLGNFITDAFVDFVVRQHKGPGWTSAPLALIQAGAIRSALYENKTRGNYTYDEVLTVLPYNTPLYKVRVPGSVLKKALEQSVSQYDDQPYGMRGGGFLQVSGIHVTYDLSKPLNNRITEVEVRCHNCSVPEYTPLKPNYIYTVIMSDYLRNGGDGYLMFKDAFAEPILDEETSLTDTNAVAKYVKHSGTIYPEIEGRIILLNFPPSKPGSAALFLSSPIIILIPILLSIVNFAL